MTHSSAERILSPSSKVADTSLCYWLKHSAKTKRGVLLFSHTVRLQDGLWQKQPLASGSLLSVITTATDVGNIYLLLFVLTYEHSGVILNTGSAAHRWYSSGAKGCLLDKRPSPWNFSSSLVVFVGASPRGSRRPSHRHAASVLEELLDDRGVGQRGDVAQVSLVTGDFAKHASHDLTCRVEDTGYGSGDKWKRRKEVKVHFYFPKI